MPVTGETLRRDDPASSGHHVSSGRPASSKEDVPEAKPLAGSAADTRPGAGVANGDAAKDAVAASDQVRQGPMPDQVKFAVTFTRIVSVLMRSPHYKHYSLSDLEWLVVSPILTGQCAVMEAKVNGRQVPVAAALWASVSEEVDKRLSGNPTTPIKLRPDEWRSGGTLWLIDAVGDPKAVPPLLRHLQQTTLKGREVKMRTLGADGRPMIWQLGSPTPPHAG